MKNFAYYRLPYADRFTIVESDREPLVMSSIEEIGEVPGFVVAPFVRDGDAPIVLIKPDRVVNEKCKDADRMVALGGEKNTVGGKAAYAMAFGKFHDAVNCGRFRKLVLARCEKCDVEMSHEDCVSLFHHACALYPRLMIMLFSTPQTGTWLVASPEILVDGRGCNLHTVALAGTMPYREGYPNWSEKNRREQHIVEQYIEQTITPLCNQITKDGPVTMRAGDLVHLRTDFRFIIDEKCALGKLISRLHPTPAVCGMPKDDAYGFIAENEGMNRSYYSGFAGPVGIDAETHLYVSLRCASLCPDVVLYAGGGIMPESTVEAEWQETERKMMTIRNVFK